MTTLAKSAHTPGPWALEHDGTIRSKQFDSSDQMGDFRGCVICDMSAGLGTAWEKPSAREHARPESEANARLIAAAPEMLEALECAETVLFLLSDEVKRLGCNAKEVLPKVKAAIQKARVAQ